MTALASGYQPPPGVASLAWILPRSLPPFVGLLLVLLSLTATGQAPENPGVPARFAALEDPGADLTLAALVATRGADTTDINFRTLSTGRISAAASGSALWLRIQLPSASATDQNRLLVIGPPYLDEVLLYGAGASSDPASDPVRAGDIVPFEKKPFPNRMHVFRLPPEAGTYYVRATSEGILRMNWSVTDEKAFLAREMRQAIGYAVLFGILGTMILFNLGIFISIGDTTYIYYVAYHVFAFLLIFSLSGYTAQFLWPGLSNTTNTSVPVALTGMSISGLFFISAFLRLRQQLPRCARVMRLTVVVVCLLALPGLLLPYSEGARFTYGGCLLVLAVMAYTVIVARRARIVAARYITITFTFAILPGSLGAFAYEYGLLPDNPIFSHMLEITTAAETLLLSLFLAYRIKSSEEAKLTAQQRAIELQHSFNERMLAKQEEERSRIARELHDSVGPNLSALHIHLRSLNSPGVQEQAPMLSNEQTIDLVKQTITEVRQVSHNLHPSHLDGLSLTHAIETYTRQFSGDGVPEFRISMDVSEAAIPEETKMHLYRIVQETVHNVIAHAEASHCFISMRQNSGRIELSIRDNGRGFDAQQRQGHGLGMTSIADRVNIMDGELEIDTQPGEGTRVTISLAARQTNE